MEVMSLKSFIGGIHPKDQKQYTKDLPIIKIKASDEVVFPLKQHIGAPCQPIVKVKDEIKVGQVIACSDAFVSSPIISSVSGVVKKIEERMDVSGKMQESIVIANDGLYQKVENNNNKQELTYEEKIERIKAAGIVGLGGAGFPTHVKLSVKDPNQVQYYIVNGAECEPYLTSDYRLMLEKTDELIAGIHILLEMFPKALCYIAIEDNKKKAIHLLKEKCKDEKRIAVKELKTKYPQEAVLMMSKIAHKIESSLDYQSLQRQAIRTAPDDTSEAICMSVAEIAYKFNVAAIIAFTESGFTARKMACYRTKSRIIAATPSLKTVKALALNWGVKAVPCKQLNSRISMIDYASIIARENGVKPGQKILVTGGTPGVKGATSYLELVEVK